MNYKQTLEYLYSQLPMFHRVGAAAYKADLNNTIALCNLLNHPYQSFKCIHIAGTNGKGSVSHFIASILQKSGLKVGLYTSPHLKDYRERIKINGKMIPETYVVNFINKYHKEFERIKPSFFETTVSIAFQYFKEEKVDIAVIETGLGGRLDSTNIISPLLSVITNIGYDHTNLLGNTIEEIAYEKAGIIKNNTPVVIGESNLISKPVFIKKATECNAPIYFADAEYQIRNIQQPSNESNKLTIDIYKFNSLAYQNLRMGLTALYQLKNIKTVLKSIEITKSLKFQISNESIYNGIENVINNTGLYGRWQILSHHPLTICDTGHNEDGINEVLKQIDITQHNTLHFVIGMVNDKDVESVLKLLPKDAIYYFCKANIPRGMDVNDLAIMARNNKLQGKTYSSVKKAMMDAQKNAQKNDLVFIGGSTYVVAEII